jgi:hypothetical protein
MKKIALALLMGISLCSIGCGRGPDAREARDTHPKFNSDTHQAHREVIHREVVNERETAENIQADLNRAAERARADAQEIRADARRTAHETVHHVTNEAQEDVKEIKSDAKRTAKKLIDDFLQ